MKMCVCVPAALCDYFGLKCVLLYMKSVKMKNVTNRVYASSYTRKVIRPTTEETNKRTSERASERAKEWTNKRKKDDLTVKQHQQNAVQFAHENGTIYSYSLMGIFHFVILLFIVIHKHTYTIQSYVCLFIWWTYLNICMRIHFQLHRRMR